MRLPAGDLLVVSETAAALVGKAAAYLERLLREPPPGRDLAVALAGGSTPLPVYRRLSSAPLPWPRLQFFLGDERLVPADHPQSNGRALAQALGPEARLLPMVTHISDLAAAAGALAEEYSRTLEAAAGSMAGGGVPRLDLILLGLGEDGHVASLFPDSPALEETRRWVTEAPGPSGGTGASPDVARLTLTLPVLSAAHRQIFLVAGAAKAAAVSRVLAGDCRLPAARIQRHGSRTVWFLDRLAAGALGGGAGSLPGGP